MTADLPDRRDRRSYAVNVDPKESRRGRLSDEAVGAFFNPKAFSIVRDTDDLRRMLLEVRVGRDVSGHIILVLILLLLAESFFANRFHRGSAGRASDGLGAESQAPPTV